MSTEENIAAHKPKDGPQEEVEDFEERVEEKVVLQRTKVLELNAKHFVKKIEQHLAPQNYVIENKNDEVLFQITL